LRSSRPKRRTVALRASVGWTAASADTCGATILAVIYSKGFAIHHWVVRSHRPAIPQRMRVAAIVPISLYSCHPPPVNGDPVPLRPSRAISAGPVVSWRGPETIVLGPERGGRIPHRLELGSRTIPILLIYPDISK